MVFKKGLAVIGKTSAKRFCVVFRVSSYWQNVLNFFGVFQKN